MVPPRRMRSATSVAGRPRPGDAAAAKIILNEQGHRLLRRGRRVARGSVITMQRAVQQAVPVRGGVRVLTENLGRLGRDGRVRHSRDRTGKLSSRSSTLVKVTNAAPGALSRAGVSRSRVLPLP